MTCWLCGFSTTERTPMCKDGPSGCQKCIAVAQIDQEIDQAVAALRRLLDKRCDLRSERNRAHDPMHRLPVELRNYIFDLALPRCNEWGDIVQVDGSVWPSYITICRSWRDTAWSNPSLWTTIRIRLGKIPTPRWIEFVRTRILRSGTLPLTFHIHELPHSAKYLEAANEDLAPVLDFVSQCSDRLQSLSFLIQLSTLSTFQHSNLQWHRLTRLQIISTWQNQINQPLSLLNPTACPESIKLCCVSINSLQISWNRLSSAVVSSLDLKDVAQLLQHASQMTDCRISSSRRDEEDFSMPPIIHHRLQKLSLGYAIDSADVALNPVILKSLTLPCLQEFHTDEFLLLSLLPKLVHRSSCPMTKLALFDCFEEDLELFDVWPPLPGVNDLVLEDLKEGPDLIKKFLLEGFFPNLRHLTLRLRPFLSLWKRGIISLLLDRKRPQPDGPTEGSLSRIFVIEQNQAPEFDRMWNSDVGEQVKELGVRLRDDGFEFL